VPVIVYDECPIAEIVTTVGAPYVTLQRPAIDGVAPVPPVDEVQATSMHPSIAVINAMGTETRTILPPVSHACSQTGT